MLLLALDTATALGSLALLEDDGVLSEHILETPGSFLVHLLPELDALFTRTGRGLKEVGAICVSQGPGNFTGLRIGLATAQGLALALGCPLIPVPTLEALAGFWAGEPSPVATLVDAKRGEVYLGRFNCAGEFPEALGGPERLAVTDLPGRLGPSMLLTGPGVTPYEDFLRGALAPEIRLAPPTRSHPQAREVGRLGRQRLKEGRTVAPAGLSPLYLRPAL